MYSNLARRLALFKISRKLLARERARGAVYRSRINQTTIKGSKTKNRT